MVVGTLVWFSKVETIFFTFKVLYLREIVLWLSNDLSSIYIWARCCCKGRNSRKAGINAVISLPLLKNTTACEKRPNREMSKVRGGQTEVETGWAVDRVLCPFSDETDLALCHRLTWPQILKKKRRERGGRHTFSSPFLAPLWCLANTNLEASTRRHWFYRKGGDCDLQFIPYVTTSSTAPAQQRHRWSLLIWKVYFSNITIVWYKKNVTSYRQSFIQMWFFCNRQLVQGL